MAGPAPAARLHVADGLKDPVSFVTKVTVPVGMLGVVDTSITLAVQVVTMLKMTEPGMHVILVWVGWSPETVVTLTVMLFDAVFPFASVTVTLTMTDPVDVNVVEKVDAVAVEFTAPLTDQANP